jgi:pilus assembly protein Flp/PilA
MLLPTKANSTERGGRKVYDLKPYGQGSGIAEEQMLPKVSLLPFWVASIGSNTDAHQNRREQDMLDQAKKFLKDEEGAAAIEYALLVGLIAVAIVAAVTALGTKVAGTFTSITGSLPS